MRPAQRKPTTWAGFGQELAGLRQVRWGILDRGWSKKAAEAFESTAKASISTLGSGQYSDAKSASAALYLSEFYFDMIKALEQIGAVKEPQARVKGQIALRSITSLVDHVGEAFSKEQRLLFWRCSCQLLNRQAKRWLRPKLA